MDSFKITIDSKDFIVVCFPNRPKALLDRVVAEIYEMPTKRINEAVRNNPEKFPDDFYFQLTLDEARSLGEVENFDLTWEKGHIPKAFTHLGCNMLATILKSPRAVQRAIQIIRTFTALESGAYDRRMTAIEKMQEENAKQIQQNQQECEKKIDQILSDLHFFLWRNQPETSPLGKLQQKIAEMESSLNKIILDDSMKHLQLQRLRADIQELREFVAREIFLKEEADSKISQIFHSCNDEVSSIESRLQKVEKKLTQLLFLLPAENLPPAGHSSTDPISSAQIAELKALAQKKTKGNRKKIAAIWRGFKKHFALSQYKNLPECRFHEALEWMRDL